MSEIHIDLDFSKYIIEVIRKYNFAKILEIGSWDGLGSTSVLIQALSPLSNKKLYCLEVNKNRYLDLVNNVKEYRWIKTFNRSSVDYENFIPKNFNNDVWLTKFNLLQYPKNMVEEWYLHDIELIKTENDCFLNNINFDIDAVFIDGGEFCGYSEYVIMKNKVKCFILDDTHKAYKNNRVMLELKKDKEWFCVFENEEERNGSAIFVKMEL